MSIQMSEMLRCTGYALLCTEFKEVRMKEEIR